MDLERSICGLVAGPLPAHPRRTRRKYVRVGAYAASMPRKVPRRWTGKDQARWSVCLVQARHDVRCSDCGSPVSPSIEFEQQASLERSDLKLLGTPKQNQVFTRPSTNARCGVPAACGDPCRHECRQGASTDGCTACPASGEGTAPSTHRAFDSSLCTSAATTPYAIKPQPPGLAGVHPGGTPIRLRSVPLLALPSHVPPRRLLPPVRHCAGWFRPCR
ncbi:Hypothetical Protein LMG19145_00286 [Xanthomonas arboricola pv. fragariae]|nr:Hypothetical Protein LMG19145_00286 [Xanthomonas arboricola pv. fragariae]